MPKTAFVTGADRGLGNSLVKKLAARGYRVFAGQYMPEWEALPELQQSCPDQVTIVPLDVSSLDSILAAYELVSSQTSSLDILINSAGVLSPGSTTPIQERQNYAGILRDFDVNALGPLRMVEVFLPLLQAAATRRLCFVSSEAGSIGKSSRPYWFGYCMSKAAVNMAVKNLFNALRPDGYTFRLYHPGWIRSYMMGEKNLEADLEPDEAADYALKYFLSGIEPELPAADEDRLALHDYLGGEYPW